MCPFCVLAFSNTNIFILNFANEKLIMNFNKLIIMKILALIAIATAILSISSCSGDDNNAAKKNEKRLVVKTYSCESGKDYNQIIFTGDDIKSFNESTREILFNRNVSFDALSGNMAFYLDEDNLFEVQYVKPIASYIINNLVLYAPGIDGKYYLQDGYPEIVQVESPDGGTTGTNISAENIAMREENKQKRAEEWDLFIKWLKKEGKLIN